MALIKCPECGREIPENAPACIFCGYPVEEDSKETPDSVDTQKEPEEVTAAQKTKESKKTIGIIAAVAVVVVAIFSIAHFYTPAVAQEDLEAAIPIIEQNIQDNLESFGSETTGKTVEKGIQMVSTVPEVDENALKAFLMYNRQEEMDALKDFCLDLQKKIYDVFDELNIKGATLEWDVMTSDQVKLYSFRNKKLTYDYFDEILSSFKKTAHTIGSELAYTFEENDVEYKVGEKYLSVKMKIDPVRQSEDIDETVVEGFSDIYNGSLKTLKEAGGENFNLTVEDTTGNTVLEYDQGSLVWDIRDEFEEERKIEILKYLHSLEDDIYSRESYYTDSELNKRLDSAQSKTCRKFDITRDELLDIMSDSSLVRRSYQ